MEYTKKQILLLYQAYRKDMDKKEEFPCIDDFFDTMEIYHKALATEPLDDIGKIYTMKQFVACCKSGGFTNYDGFARYATGNRKNKNSKMANFGPYPDDIRNNDDYDRSFSHVMWYNR